MSWTRTERAAHLVGGAFVMSVPAIHLGVASPGAGFRVAMLAGATGALTALVLLARGPRRAGALLPALAPALFLASLVVTARQHPVLNDVSTAPTDPPVYPHPQDIPPGVAARPTAEAIEASARAHPSLNSIQVPGTDPRVVEARVRDLLADLGLEVTPVPPGRGPEGVPREVAVHATETSKLFRFVDDVVVRVRQVEPGRVRIDVRSRSRVGRSDLGANVARVRRILAALADSTPPGR